VFWMKSSTWVRFGFAALAVAVLWQLATPLLACPACKEAVRQAAEGSAGGVDGSGNAGLGRGFFWSILTMLAVVYGLAGVGIYAVVRLIRKSQRAQNAVSPVGYSSPTAASES